jgi:LPXTG-motif cell wall-anchored protein
MRSRVVRAGAALFMATAAFVPAHLASASSIRPSVEGFQCPADQALFDFMKAYIQQLVAEGVPIPPPLANLDDAALCALVTQDPGVGSTSTTEPATSTSVPDTTSTSEPSTSTTSENSTTSTTGESTTTTPTENTTTTAPEQTSTTVAQETTTTTAQETTTTTRPTTTTTAATTSTTAATTSTTAATTSTTGATSTTEAHVTTDPTVGGIVVTGAGTLPVTGNDPAPLVALGFLTAGLGVGLVLVRRRFAS